MRARDGVIGWLCILLAQAAMASAPLELSPDKTHCSGGAALCFFQETGRQLTFEEAASPEWERAYEPVRAPFINEGIVHGAYWFRLTLHNTAETAREFVIELSNPRLVQIDWYDPQPDGALIHHELGTTMAFGVRPLPYATPAFPIELSPGEQRTVYMRIQQRGSLRFFLSVWDAARFPNNKIWTQMRDGMFYGAMLLMIVFQLLLLVTTRAMSYLYISLFTIAVLMFLVAVNGLGFQLLWPNAPAWTERAPIFFLGIAVSSICLFGRQYMATWERAILWDRCLIVLALLGLGISLARIFDGVWVNHLANMTVAVTSCTLIGTALITVREKRKARLFLASWMLFFSICLFYTLSMTTGLSAAFLAEFMFQAGFPVMLVLVLMAIWLRIRQVDMEHRHLLEARVEERTQALRTALEEVKTLQGLLPICSSCHKIRNDEGCWDRLENYIREHTEADFTHSLCPECLHDLYPELAKRVEQA